jgi:hypothetical protein
MPLRPVVASWQARSYSSRAQQRQHDGRSVGLRAQLIQYPIVFLILSAVILDRVHLETLYHGKHLYLFKP